MGQNLDCCNQRDKFSAASDSVNLRAMSHFNDVCSKYNFFIFDIDGTLVHDNHPIDGVADAIFKLAIEHDKKIFFYTNGGYCTQYRHW